MMDEETRDVIEALRREQARLRVMADQVPAIESTVDDLESRIEELTRGNGGGFSHVPIRGESGYPFGARHNFGFSISGAVVTILRGTTKRGRAAYAIGAIESASVTITADMDWVAIEMTSGTAVGDDTFAYARYADRPGPPDDNGPKAVVGLHQFRLVGGQAHWHYSTHFDGNFTGMGH